jgi:hypothetical protein
MGDDDISPERAFKAATLGSLRVAALMPAGAIAGQLVVVLFMYLFGVSEVHDGMSFVVLLCVSLFYGMMSAAGAVVVLLDLWLLLRTLQEEMDAIDFFLVIAAGQIVCYITSTVVLGTFHRTWFIGPLSLVVLGGFWLGSLLWRRRSVGADIERMKAEGEKFQREMRERKSKGAIRRFRN